MGGFQTNIGYSLITVIMGFENTKFQSTVQLRKTPSTDEASYGESLWVDTEGRILVKFTPENISRSGEFEYHIEDESGSKLAEGLAETRSKAKEKIKAECSAPVVFDEQKPARRDNDLFV